MSHESEHFPGPFDWQKDEKPLYQERHDPALRTRIGKLLHWMGFKSPNEQ